MRRLRAARSASLGRTAGRAVLCVAVSMATACFPAAANAEVADVDRVAGRAPGSALAVRGAPDVEMRAGILVTGDGRELWSRAATGTTAIASVTKVMTALVVLKKTRLEEQITVPAAASRMGESSAKLEPGQAVSVRKLLEAMLVRSGNDAAMTLAHHAGGSEPGFVALMNEEAGELGLEDTQFANSHGLDESGHFSSAADVAVLSRAAMRVPEFRRIVGLRRITIDGPSGEVLIEASNELLGSYRGAIGVKTGWTDDAGYCLVAAAERGGIQLMAVVLGAQGPRSRFRQAERLLDWGFANYLDRQLTSAGETAGVVPVADWLDVGVPVVVAETTRAPVFDVDGEVTRRLALPKSVRAPVRSGDKLGMLTLVQGERLLARVPLVAAADVPEPSPLQRFRIGLIRLWRRLAG